MSESLCFTRQAYKEEKAFDALADIATRFSDIEDDLNTYPGVYYTPEELHKKLLKQKKF